MSNIPFNAISHSMDAIQRPANESLRARKVQAQKNVHHNEDVEELDDTAVDSIRDQNQDRGEGGQEEREEQQAQLEERLDLQSLPSPPKKNATPKLATPQSHLDISA